jgi:hypothetical protein
VVKNWTDLYCLQNDAAVIVARGTASSSLSPYFLAAMIIGVVGMLFTVTHPSSTKGCASKKSKEKNRCKKFTRVEQSELHQKTVQVERGPIDDQPFR